MPDNIVQFQVVPLGENGGHTIYALDKDGKL
jgi:hypothetical protein